MNPASDDAPLVVLFGGGVESTYLVNHYLGKEKTVLPIYVHCGMLWEDVELGFARRFCHAFANNNLQPLRVIHVQPDGAMHNHWALTGRDVPKAGDGPERLEIPVRNLSLLRAVALSLPDLPSLNIVMGTTADNSYDDGTRAFFDETQHKLSEELSRPVSVLTPLIELHKSDVIRQSDRVKLAASFSCVNPVGDRHCGNCVKCGSRQTAFAEAGVADPTDYANGGQSIR